MNNKKIFSLVVILVILTGCNMASKKAPATTLTWTSVPNPNSQVDETKSVERGSSEEKVTVSATPSEVPAPAPVSTPAPAKAETQPAPVQAKSDAPALASEPVTHSIPVGPYGTPGVVLSNPHTVTYRPAYAVYNDGYMFRFQNDSSKLYWVAPAGNVAIRPLMGQCMESSRLPSVPNPEACPFIELPTNTGSRVVLIKPGYSAKFVVDMASCPPDGSACKVRIQSVPYSSSAITRPDLSRKWVRTFDYPASNNGYWWARSN